MGLAAKLVLALCFFAGGAANFGGNKPASCVSFALGLALALWGARDVALARRKRRPPEPEPSPEQHDGGAVSIRRADYSRINDLYKYVVLDVETTGLDRRRDRIVRLAWITYTRYSVTGSYATFVNPGMHIPEAATRINGITDRDVRFAPTYEKVRPRVAGALAGATVVGHNVGFDLDFTLDMLSGCGVIRFIDTLDLAKRAFPGLKSYSLSSLCRELSIEVPGDVHPQLRGAYAANELFTRCRLELYKQGEARRSR